MKKVFISFSLVLIAVFLLLPLSACKKSSFSGKYKVNSLSCMGLTATQKSFSEYSANRSEADKTYNTLYKPLKLLFNSVLILNDDETAKLEISEFESFLSDDKHYSKTLSSAKEKGYIKNGSLVIENLKWSVDKSQNNAYYVFAVDESNNYMSLSEIWGNTLFSADHIHARVEKGQLACKIKVCIYETDETERTTVALTTNITINMKK